MIIRYLVIFFVFLISSKNEVFAVPASSIQLSCTGGTAFAFNDIYFSLQPSKDTEIDIHNAYDDRLGVHVTQNSLHHFWLKGRYDEDGRGYVTIDSIDTGVNFGASALYCMNPTDREALTNAGYYDPGSLGGEDIENILVMYNVALSVVALFFFIIILGKRE